jgi:hypothetical protein
MLLFAVLLAACGRAEPEITVTFEQAAEIVLEQVVRPDALDREIIVFGWSELIEVGDTLSAYRPPAAEGLPAERGLSLSPEHGIWFFWIDDAPGAKFAHPNRFITVDGASGEVSVQEELWWPLLNSKGLWVTTEQYWDEANWIFSNLSWRRTSAAAPVPGGVLAYANSVMLGQNRLDLDLVPGAQIPSPGAAIVINRWRDGETLQEDFETDADVMHDIFEQSSFDTTYLGPTQDDNSDRDGDNSYDSIGRWFGQQGMKLKPSQMLFVYLAGHGYVSSSDGQGVVGGISEGLLKVWLENFNPGVHIVVMVDSCYAGSFIDSMNQVADFTITSTNATDPSYGDVDPSEDPNPNDKGSEFTSGFVEDWDKILDDWESIKRVRERAEREGVNFYEALSAESFVTAVEKDAAAIKGWSFPLTGHGIPATRVQWTPIPTRPPLAQTGDSVNYRVGSEVAEDEANHERPIDMPDEYTLTLEYTLSGIKYIAEEPFVTVEGTLEADGSFETSGQGTVAGFPNIGVTFNGQIVGNTITGTYGMGVNGGLPQGLPIYYAVEGVEEVPPSGPAATPNGSGQPVGGGGLPPDVIGFYEGFNQAFESQDPQTLLMSLHPRVTDIYGFNACTAYLEDVILNPTAVEVLSVSGPEAWNWVIDGQIIPVADAYSVDLNVTAGGQTVERLAHLAPREDGALGPLGWFTDCGDPSRILNEREPTGTPTWTPAAPAATSTPSPTPVIEALDTTEVATTTGIPLMPMLCAVLAGLIVLGGLGWWIYDYLQWPLGMLAETPEGEPIDDRTYQLKTEAQCDKPCYEVRAAIRRPNRIQILEVTAHTLHKSTGAVIDTNVIPGRLADRQNIMNEFGKSFDVPTTPDGIGEEFLYRDGRCDPGCKCAVPAGAQPSKRKRTSRRLGLTFVKELQRTLNKPFIDPQTGQETQHPDMMSPEEVQRYLSDADALLPHQPGQPYRVKTTMRYEVSLRVPVELRKYDGRCVPFRFDPSTGRV